MQGVYRICFVSVALATSAALPRAAHASTLTPVFAIPGFNDGALSVSHLTEFGGRYYGTANSGGPGKVQSGQQGYLIGNGVIYSIEPTTGKYAIVHYFGGAGDGSNPLSDLTLFQGKLYGTTTAGGVNNGGVVFTLEPQSGAETVVASLPGGLYAQGGLTFFQGKLYGTGTTAIFSFDPSSGAAQIEYEFQCGVNDGCFPAGLIVHNNYLLGTADGGGASNNGTLFRFDPGLSTVLVEHSFGADQDGSGPQGGLIEVGATFYGTTFSGGSSADGTIYSFNPETGQEAIVYSFARPNGIGPEPGLLSYNGLLYGATFTSSTYNDGTLFAFDPSTSSLRDVHIFNEGMDQGPALELVDGKLWGILTFGGVLGEGALFSVDPASGHLTILHSFAGAQIAGASGLTKINGSLFGTAVGGGAYGLGSIFKVVPGSSSGQTLYSFQGGDGAYPMAPLTAIGGTLYGTSNLGGGPTASSGFSAGTIFSFQPATRVMTSLAAFDGGALGGNPVGPMAMPGGALFGTTTQGGSGGSGSIFKFDPATDQLTTVASFPYAFNGASLSGLTVAGNLLYGTASQGGTSNRGVIFSVEPSSGRLTTLYSFTGGSDGAYPDAALTYSNGLLYGSTPGKRGQPATVFSFDPTKGAKTITRSIAGQPQIQAAFTESGGKLYDTFPTATLLNAPYGGIVRINPMDGHSTITILPAGPVANPASTFTLSNNALFGTTFTSTTDNAGTVFKYVP